MLEDDLLKSEFEKTARFIKQITIVGLIAYPLLIALLICGCVRLVSQHSPVSAGCCAMTATSITILFIRDLRFYLKHRRDV